jgi:hypothetical protein
VTGPTLKVGMPVAAMTVPRSFRAEHWEGTGHVVALTWDEEVNVSMPSMADGTETTAGSHFWRLP